MDHYYNMSVALLTGATGSRVQGGTEVLPSAWSRLGEHGLELLPEALKIKAETCHEYMNSLAHRSGDGGEGGGRSGVREEQRALAAGIGDTFGLLMAMVHENHRGFVMDMQASLLSGMGE